MPASSRRRRASSGELHGLRAFALCLRDRPFDVDELLGGLGKPVLARLVFGHTKEKATIPLGVEAELDAGAKTFTIVEAATRG